MLPPPFSVLWIEPRAARELGQRSAPALTFLLLISSFNVRLFFSYGNIVLKAVQETNRTKKLRGVCVNQSHSPNSNYCLLSRAEFNLYNL